jgi:hypothetical protein
MPEPVSTHAYLSLRAKRGNPFAARREHRLPDPDCFQALPLAATSLAVIARQARQSRTPPIPWPGLLRRFVPGNDSENPRVNPDKGETDVEVSDLDLDSWIEVTDYHTRRLTAISHDAGGNAHFNQPERGGPN